MTPKLFLNLAYAIICLFTVSIFYTFIPEYLHSFFGDTLQTEKPLICLINDGYDWGIRHYLFYTMSVLLFILALLDSYIYSIKHIIKEYPNWLK